MSNIIKNEYELNIAIHPGVTLEDTLIALGMTQKELADRTGLATKTINEIVKGKSALTAETAIKLERVFDIPASFWNNLEKNYQQTMARLEAERELEEELSLARTYANCYKELADWGLVKRTSDWHERTRQLLNFFSVSSLKLVKTTEPIAFRRSESQDISNECLAVWLRWGEKEARLKHIGEFDKDKLSNIVSELRLLTMEDPLVFQEALTKLCAQCGIIVVFIPYIEKTYVNGATRWLNDSALIQLSLRYKYDDIFWFTFFHELGHILKHGKRAQFVDFEERFKKKSKEEEEADEFAANILIPKKEYKQFMEERNFSVSAIHDFAANVDISPSVIAGRLAHDGELKWSAAAPLRRQLKLMKGS